MSQDDLEKMRESERRYNEKHKNKPGSNEIVKDYFNKISQSAPVNNASSLEDLLKNLGSVKYQGKQKRNQITDYKTARALFGAISDKITGKPYILNEYNEKVVENAVKWFIADKSSEFPLDKGIGLIGYYGTGKTHLFKVLEIMAQAFRRPEIEFSISNCPGIVKEVSENATSLKKYYSGTFCFDDLGSEETVVKSYGNAVGVLSDILFEREIRHESGGQITHFTSNLIAKELQAKYGDRIYDRLQKMTTLVVIKQNFSFRNH